MELKFESYNEFINNALCVKKIRLGKTVEIEKFDYKLSPVEEAFTTFKNAGIVEDSIKLKIANLKDHNPEILEAYCKNDETLNVVVKVNFTENTNIIIDENVKIIGNTIYKIYFTNQVSQKLTSLKLYEANKFKFYKYVSNTLDGIDKVEFVVISTAKTSKTHDVDAVNGFTLDLEKAKNETDHETVTMYGTIINKVFDNNISTLKNDKDGHGYPYVCMIGHNICEYIDNCNVVNDFITDK